MKPFYKYTIMAIVLGVGAYVLFNHSNKQESHKEPLASDSAAKPVVTKNQNTEESKISPSSEDSSQFISENDSPEMKEKKEKVIKALAEFNEKMNSISKEDLEIEQEKMQEAKDEMQKVSVSKPKEELHTDANGQKWTKLTYEDGTIRYEFPKS